MAELLNARTREEKREVYETYKVVVQDIRPLDLYYVTCTRRIQTFQARGQKDTQQVCEYVHGRDQGV
ncbi:MAG: hypothetical protein ACOCSM_01780 [Bacillota bacterium]